MVGGRSSDGDRGAVVARNEPHAGHRGETPRAATDDARKWLVLVGVVASVLLATIDGSIVNVALPTMREAFATTFGAVQWVALGYFLTMAIVILPVGRLGDVHGRKRIYIAGLATFTVASVLCGLAPSVEVLIACRIVQALGAAMMLALAPSILVDAFPTAERGMVLGFVWTAVSIGIVVGPVLGGFLIAVIDWRAIFFVNVPIGLAGIWLAAQFVRDASPPSGQRMDYLGAGLLGVSLLCLCLGLTLGLTSGAGAIFGAAVLLAALAAGIGFVVVQLRRTSPLIDLRIFQAKPLWVSLIAGLATFAASSAAILLMPFYLQGVLGYATTETGLLLSVAPFAMGVISPIAGALSDRFGVRLLSLLGLAVLCLTYLALTLLEETTSAAGFAALWIPIGVGMGIFQSPNNSAVMGAAPPHYAGVASGLLTMTRLIGQLAGVAVLGSFWSTRVTLHADGPVPGGASSAAASAQVAALHDVFMLAAALLAGAAVLTMWGVRNDRRGSAG
jgi:EmrB/QacA subfamily drug resistance transporter